MDGLRRNAVVRWSFVLATGLGGSAVHAGGTLVDLELNAATNNVAVGQNFNVQIIARTNDPSNLTFFSTTVVLTWDPRVVEIRRRIPNQGHNWFESGFFPTRSLNDGVNQTGRPFNDGDAMYENLPIVLQLPVADADGLVVDVIEFRALTAGCSTTVRIEAQRAGLQTQVAGEGFGEIVTGTLGSTVLNVSGVEGDADGDSVGNCTDLCAATPPEENTNDDGCSCSQVTCLFCDGETCVDGVCQPGAAPCPGQACDEDSRKCLCDDNGDCSDGNPCTTNTCNGGDCTTVNNTAACNDGNLCTQNDTCSNGVCAGTAIDCSNLNDACNVGVCNAGVCVAQPINEAAGCNDGNGCTTVDICTGGTCAGTPVDCSDFDDACNEGLCNPQTSQCVQVPANEGGACDDANKCTDPDTCNGGNCSGAFLADCDCLEDGECDDGNACTDDDCDDVSGFCTSTNDDTNLCDDGLPCTTTDACTDGVCGGVAVDCSHLDDDCNVGVCNVLTGVCEQQASNEDGACDDGLFCNIGETCTAGECGGGSANPCNDNFACTVDTCDEIAEQCVQTPNDNLCNDNKTCTDDACFVGLGCLFAPDDSNSCSDENPCTDDACSNGDCESTAVTCPDSGDPCTRLSCNPAGADGNCDLVLADNEGGGCNDGNNCTTTDLCAAGACAGTAVDCSVLDDDCNNGACNPTNGQCQPVPANQNGPCDDADVCTQDDRCNGGVCLGTPIGGCQPCNNAAECNDNNPCTDNTCPAGFCEYPNNTAACNDGFICTQNDTCSNGSCAGTPINCSHLDNVCNVGQCNLVTGQCEARSVNDGGACNDGNLCTTNDQCNDGVCAGAAVNCSGLNNTCNVGVCNAGTGNCQAQPTNQGGACSDGQFCTVGETCTAGVCGGGANRNCTDGIACTVDTCNDVIDQCISTPDHAACDDGNPCTDQTCVLGIGCQVVNNNTNDCVDGDFCNGVETCTTGVCTSPGDPCVATGRVCNEAQDRCDCDDNDDCNDGQFCTGTETCNVGVCQSSGNPCAGGQTCNETTDTCDDPSPSDGGGGFGGGGPPPPPPPDNEPGVSIDGDVDADGNAALTTTLDSENINALINVSGATPGANLSVRLVVNDGPPGVNGSSTFAGFSGELALGTTLEIDFDGNLGGGTVTIQLTVPLALISELGLDPEDVDLHVFDGDLQAWVRAGDEFVGQASPEDAQVGEYGFEINGDLVTYWAVRSEFSVFAAGQNEAGPSEIIVVSEIPDSDPEPEPDPEPDPDPDVDNENVNDNDDDVIVPDNSTDDDDDVLVPSQNETPSCGSAAAPCGAIGLINLTLCVLGLSSMRRQGRRRTP